MDFQSLLYLVQLGPLILLLLLLLLSQHELSNLLLLEHDAQPTIRRHRLVSLFLSGAWLDSE